MKDITDLIDKASKALTHSNPLISTSSFNLYESMSALDLMDPKMDGCEIPLSYYKPSHKQDEVKMKTVPPRPVPNSLNESSLIWGDEVSVRHVRVILVEMLVRLDSLLSGNSVAESVYTSCLYAHNTMLHDMEDKL